MLVEVRGVESEEMGELCFPFLGNRNLQSWGNGKETKLRLTPGLVVPQRHRVEPCLSQALDPYPARVWLLSKWGPL